MILGGVWAALIASQSFLFADDEAFEEEKINRFGIPLPNLSPEPNCGKRDVPMAMQQFAPILVFFAFIIVQIAKSSQPKRIWSTLTSIILCSLGAAAFIVEDMHMDLHWTIYGHVLLWIIIRVSWLVLYDSIKDRMKGVHIATLAWLISPIVISFLIMAFFSIGTYFKDCLYIHYFFHHYFRRRFFSSLL